MNPSQYKAIGVKLTRKQKKLVNLQNKENKQPNKVQIRVTNTTPAFERVSDLPSTKLALSRKVDEIHSLLSKLSAKKTKKSKPRAKTMPPKFVKRAEQAIARKAKEIAVKEGKKLLRNNAEKIGAAAGVGVGALLGPAAGVAVGAMAEQGAIKISGNGDYTVTSNSLFNKGASVDVIPKFQNTKRGTRVTHCEYLGDVISSSTANTFSLTSYVVNPGNPTTFPWLAPIAANYDQWRPNGIVFAFKSTSSSYSGTTQALGGVVLASDYDLVDEAFASKIEMENSAFANSCKSDTHILHPIECNPRERQVSLLKCRGVQTPTDNLQWYDLANFQVATFGVAGTSVNLGELWVTYDITFFKEQVYGGLRGNTLLRYVATATTGVSTSAYFGASPVANAYNTLPLVLTGTTITFPDSIPIGSYQLKWYINGDTTGVVKPTLTYTRCALDTSAFIYYTNFTGTSWMMMIPINITGPGAVITFSGGTVVANSSYMGLVVDQVNPLS